MANRNRSKQQDAPTRDQDQLLSQYEYLERLADVLLEIWKYERLRRAATDNHGS